MSNYVRSNRPNKISFMVLPRILNLLFNGYVKHKNIPHLLLVGNPGIGKTTIAKALCNELEIEPLFINASKDGGINLIRDVLEPYCKNPSFAGMYDTSKLNKKIVILDEIDNTTKDFKEAFKSFIELYEKNVIFILTANSIVNFTQPLMSRFKAGYINFDEIYSGLSENEIDTFKTDIQLYVENLLKTDGIEYQTQVIQEIISIYYPDVRSILNETERSINLGDGKLVSFKLDKKYDIRSYFSMNLSTLIKEVSKIEDKYLFFKSIMDYIIENDDETIYLIISDLIENLKNSFNKNGIVNLIIMIKKLNTSKNK